MKYLLLAFLLLLLLPVSGWGGEIHYKAWRDGGPAPWEYETHFIISRYMEDNVVFNVQGASSGEIRIEHWLKGAEPCGGDSKPYQIRTIPADECNEFLREYPEWEPYDTTWFPSQDFLDKIRSGETLFYTGGPMKGWFGFIHLRRRLEE
jgi:hypothetical protein